MNSLKLKKVAVTALLSACCFSTAMPTLVYADSMKTVTLGADLTQDQKNLVLSYFGIKDEDKSQYNFITINNQEEREALKGIVPTEQIGTKTFSCAYIDPTTEGGINVETTNLTYVTDSMIASALTTAGVENCDVKAASPFDVSGTGALTGAMKAYEVATDQKLDEKKKDIANKEIKASVDLADEVGDDDATTLINDSKEKVIEDAAKSKDGLTEEDVQKIVDDSLAKNNLEVSKENQDELVKLLMEVSKQNYDLSVVKNNLEQVSDKLSETADKIKDKVDNEETKEEAKSWSDEYNDQLNVPGTVCVRWGEHGDYYGVLRGAAMVNVPGLIIEHGFHTIPEVRKLALTGELLEKWAEADANGIAEGYELMKKEGD